MSNDFDFDMASEVKRVGSKPELKRNGATQKRMPVKPPVEQRQAEPAKQVRKRTPPRKPGEIVSSRRGGGSTKSNTAKPSDKQSERKDVETAQKNVVAPSSNRPLKSRPTAEPLADDAPGFKVEQSHQESPGGSNTSRQPADSVDWKNFKVLPGIFKYVGGTRPVRLESNIKRIQLQGVPGPMVTMLQTKLKEDYEGAIVDFPWGSYPIQADNKVFTQKTSLARYLLFDGFRDDSDLHVQYAKQWLALQHPAFDATFDPALHMGPSDDALDIYALILASSMAASGGASERTGVDEIVAERLGMINGAMQHMAKQLKDQELAMTSHMERMDVTQTILVLDRMGLLRGGLPRDMGQFVKILEDNRQGISDASRTIGQHTGSERARRETLLRDAQREKLNQRRNNR